MLSKLLLHFPSPTGWEKIRWKALCDDINTRRSLTNYCQTKYHQLQANQTQLDKDELNLLPIKIGLDSEKQTIKTKPSLDDFLFFRFIFTLSLLTPLTTVKNVLASGSYTFWKYPSALIWSHLQHRFLLWCRSLHRLQGNVCFSTWSTSSDSFSLVWTN